MKTCTKCGSVKPLKEFYSDASHKDLHGSACKVCVQLREKTAYKENPKKINARNNKYRVAHLQEVRAKSAEYRQRNRDKINVKHAARYEREKEDILTRQATYYAKNASRVWERNMVRKYGITAVQYFTILAAQGGGCKICGVKIPNGRGTNFHVDHKHGTKEARGLLCHHCNIGLGNFHDDPIVLLAAAQYLIGC